MSGIIKSQSVQSLSSVRDLKSPPVSARPSMERQQADRHLEAITTLQKERDDKIATIAELRAEIGESYKQGLEAGRLAGLAEAKQLQEERLSLLSTSLAGVQEDIRTELASMERLAALLASACLDKMLGDSQDRAGLVRDLIHVQIRAMDVSDILSVQLSAVDFPDLDQLATLAASLGLPPSILTASQDLKSGDCTMALTLGQLDLGIGQQWNALRTRLNAMAGQRGDA